MLKYKLALGLGLISSVANAGDLPEVPLPLLGAGGPVAIGAAAVGYIGYRIYKRNK